MQYLIFSPAEKAALAKAGFTKALIRWWQVGGFPGRNTAVKVAGILKRPVLDVLYGPEAARQIRNCERARARRRSKSEGEE